MLRRACIRFSAQAAAVGGGGSAMTSSAGSAAGSSTKEEPLFDRVRREGEADMRTWNMKKQMTAFYDPVEHQNSYETLMRKSAAPSNQRGSAILKDENFSLSAEDYRRWLDLEKACTILQMDKDKLSGLKIEDIDAAWRPLYTHASNQREQAEILASAQVLMEYIDTPLYEARKKLHFADFVRKARADIEETARRDKQQFTNKAVTYFGWAQAFVTVMFVCGGFMIMGQVRRKDVDGIFERAKRRIAVILSVPTNTEPAPDYSTRYRDTPTTLDEYEQSPLKDIDDPVVVALAEEVALQERQEQALLAELAHDMPAPYEEPKAPAHRVGDLSVMQLVAVVNEKLPSSMQRQVQEITKS